MNRKKIFAFALIVALLVAVQTVSAYTLAPDFSFTDTEGQTHTLSSFRGEVVLLEFFSTSCLACTDELDQLKTVYNQSPTDFVMISISRDDSSSVVKTYKNDHSIPWIMAGNGWIIYDLYADKFCGSGTPQIYIIDQAGYIRYCHISITMSSTLITEIGELISPPTPTITVSSPNGGENWVRGTVYIITWSSSDNPGTYVKIELLKAGIVDAIITSSADNNGSFSWTISSDQTPGTDYRIRISSTSQPVNDTSDADFAITSTTVTPVVESCSLAGDQKDLFDLGETIYVAGANFSASKTYNFSIVTDEETWTDGMIIPEPVPSTVVTVSSNENGNIPVTAVWNGSQTVGKYDIVVDVNGNGQYDVGIDALDDNDIDVASGFIISIHQSIADLNNDGNVNILDLSIVARAFGGRPGDLRWDPIADVDKNSVVNILDLSLIAKDFGKTF